MTNGAPRRRRMPWGKIVLGAGALGVAGLVGMRGCEQMKNDVYQAEGNETLPNGRFVEKYTEDKALIPTGFLPGSWDDQVNTMQEGLYSSDEDYTEFYDKKDAQSIDFDTGGKPRRAQLEGLVFYVDEVKYDVRREIDGNKADYLVKVDGKEIQGNRELRGVLKELFERADKRYNTNVDEIWESKKENYTEVFKKKAEKLFP